MIPKLYRNIIKINIVRKSKSCKTQNAQKVKMFKNENDPKSKNYPIIKMAQKSKYAKK